MNLKKYLNTEETLNYNTIEELEELEQKLTNDIEYYRNTCLFLCQDYIYNKIIKLSFKYEIVAIKLLNFYAKNINEEKLLKIQKFDKKRIEYENLRKYCAETLNIVELY